MSYYDQFYQVSERTIPSDHIGEKLVDLSESEVNDVRSFVIERNFMFQISSIKKVHNNFLEALYDLKKAEIKARFGKPPAEQFLIHVTSVKNAGNIIKDNFDWRRITRGKFGIGTSFSDDAQYANRYANYNIGDNRALIINKVLVSRWTKGSKDELQILSAYDTSVGNNRVYVKFYDHEMLPIFVIYYNNRSLATPLRNINEYSRPLPKYVGKQAPRSFSTNNQQSEGNIKNILRRRVGSRNNSSSGRQNIHPRPSPTNAQPPLLWPRQVMRAAAPRPSQPDSIHNQHPSPTTIQNPQIQQSDQDDDDDENGNGSTSKWVVLIIIVIIVSVLSLGSQQAK